MNRSLPRAFVFLIRALALLRHIYHWFAPKPVQKALKPLLRPRLALVQSQALRHASGSIISGPFKGMKFGAEPISLLMVLGTYELELHEIFEELADKSFTRIFDIGAAEGYYAVGTALWQPQCQVFAFEANPVYHQSIERLAKNNNVTSRIEIRGACQLSDLKSLGESLAGSFMIVDIEGYEKELLRPDEVPSLKKATILVEVHDNFVPGCAAAIRNRFELSHTISSYDSEPRHVSQYPIKSLLSGLSFMAPALIHSISDGRSAPNGWLLLAPKDKPNVPL